jgi:DNA-binding XRE family transcriptional regulator
MERSQSVGGRIRRLRDRRGITQEALAGLVGRTRRWLIAVEQDEVDLRVSDLVRLADALHTQAPDLISEPSQPRNTSGSVPVSPPRDTGGGDDVKRRDFLRYTTTMLAGAPFLDSERLANAMERPASADARLLDEVSTLLDGYNRQFWNVAPRFLLPPVRHLLATLKGLVDSTRDLPLRRRAQSLTGETAVLCGLLSFRHDNRGDARSCLTLAEDLAEAAGDMVLRANALAALHSLHSSVPTGGMGGDTRLALAMLDDAAVSARRQGSPQLRTWIHAARAEEHAVLGNDADARRDLDAAEHAMSTVNGRAPGFFEHWDASRLSGFRGNCELLLGRPAEAARVLEDVLADTSPDLHGPYACVSADLAAAAASEGDVERACDLLGRGLQVAYEAGAGPDGIDRIVGIRRRYLPDDSAAVRQLDERLLLAR